MLNGWNYKDRTDEIRYGGEGTYVKTAGFLDGCGPLVEDWGCGGAYARKFFTKSRYVGVDGSQGRCDIVADLRERVSEVDGILIRHVLEHNYDWPIIVGNAVRSCLKRMAIVFFIEPQDWTRLMFPEGNGIPNLAISKKHLSFIFNEKFKLQWEEVEDKGTWPEGKEWILYANRILS